MDKQKQIEEMAIIALKNTMSYTCAKQIAMNFYNAGYRKIPKGAVVLTKEECEKVVERVQELEEALIDTILDIADELLHPQGEDGKA